MAFKRVIANDDLFTNFVKMKYLAIVFSIYMTLLSLMPCQDKEDIASNFIFSTSFHSSHSAKEHSGQEVCPPFCTCSCCSTARTLTSKPLTIVFFKIVESQYPDSKISALQDQPLSVWQPPQSV
ncbi:DUF6660 family protein [Mucilaginibacter phyllosphaerae]|uniref:Uncharacterized protein n=2 Tax=Mucilaginibacter phyllosphaerae TaxID=1812349 RepID=A0A4Y8AE01_9SPHI|nr:DUF6660 family protein [Mucilaginibacter phyllosphaerae]MBB3971266.1 hypothetical protein [Mucilaginibacter phyllosphaerae]TEW66837.1 hypothetical protein E2R65_10500 [Mucilaginibacter phyllosphaerae]